MAGTSGTDSMQSSLHELRMARFQGAGLYVVTSAEFSAGRTSHEVAAACLERGVKLIQIREKNMPTRELLSLVEQVCELAHAVEGVVIVNDRLDVALAAGADGVHLGQEDLPIEAARNLAPDMIIGASSHNLEEALAAAEAGASYVNIGPLFQTATKAVPSPLVGMDGLRSIGPRVPIPFTVMGGIKAHHIPDLVAAGAQTVALVTAVTAAPDPGEAAAELLRLIRTARDSVG